MLKKILGTIGTRYMIALLNLLLIFVNARVLGVEGVGLAGIIVASVNIVTIFNGILAGNTIVYFMNRYSMRAIILPAYAWALIGSLFAGGVMMLFDMVPAEYGWDIVWLSLISSLVTANARFLLGKDRIAGFNLTFVLQGGLLFFVLLVLYYVMDKGDVRSYVNGMYITNLVAFIVSLLLVMPLLDKEKERPQIALVPLLKEMFAYGLWAGADNLAEVFTTRLNYYFIRRWGGLGSVGLLDAGTKISESVWHISRSVSFIEYEEVARTNEAERQKEITLRLFRVTLCAMAAVMLCILCIPEWVYTDYLFTAEFVGMRKVIIGLAVGIVALGCNSILSHYFIGSGRIKLSTASSCVGFVTLLIAGYLFIPAFGIFGSAITTSIAFTAMLLFSLIVFIRITHAKITDFIPKGSDFREVKKLFGKK